MTKVLIFDHDPRVSHYLALVMAGIGCTPIMSESLTQTRALLDSDPEIGLLILDNRPDLKERGRLFLSDLRKTMKFLPVIACGAVPPDDEILALAAYLPKPFLKHRIIREVKKVLRLN